MTTVVNTPATDTGTNNGLVIGIVLVALLLLGLLYFGGRTFRNGSPATTPETNTNQPSEVNNNYAPDVPSEIDVNVNPGIGGE
jgi:LPXTG-motif cell wall-anchored protein